jgi:hypothetical protein
MAAAALIVQFVPWRTSNDAPPLPAALVTLDELEACFARQQLACVYFEDEPGRRSAAKLLSKDEARRIAVNIAKLSELPSKPKDK